METWQYTVALLVAHRQCQAAPFAGILHHGQFHLHARKREAGFGLILQGIANTHRPVAARQDTHGAGKIRTQHGKQIEIVSRADIARVVFLHRLAQFVFRKKVGEEGWQGPAKRLRVLPQSPGRTSEREAKDGKASGRAIGIVEMERVEVTRRPDDRANLQIVQQHLKERDGPGRIKCLSHDRLPPVVGRQRREDRRRHAAAARI